MTLTLLFLVLALLAALGSLTTYFGRLHWLVELASHFQPPYAVTALVCAIVLLLQEAPLAAGVAFLCAVPSLVTLCRWIRGWAPRGTHGSHVRLMTFNVQATNKDFKAVQEVVHMENPDIFCLMEVTGDHGRAMDAFKAQYPYMVTNVSGHEGQQQPGGGGIALFSRYPLEQKDILFFGKSWMASVVAQAVIDGQRLQLVGTHPVSPKSAKLAANRLEHLDALGHWLQEQTLPTVVMGDFNLTPGSFAWFEFLATSGVRLLGDPLMTFPAPLPMMGLDHIMGKNGVFRRNCFTGEAGGSDHLPVIAEITVGHKAQS